MSAQLTATPGSLLLTPKDHALILIDFQSQMSFATHSIDAVNLRTNAALIAGAAAGFEVPTCSRRSRRKASLVRCSARSRTSRVAPICHELDAPADHRGRRRRGAIGGVAQSG